MDSLFSLKEQNSKFYLSLPYQGFPQATVSHLEKSHLPRAALSQIWQLSDVNGDGQLDQEEFCIAMQLIMVVTTGNVEMGSVHHGY